jgi:hypothetical protein
MWLITGQRSKNFKRKRRTVVRLLPVIISGHLARNLSSVLSHQLAVIRGRAEQKNDHLMTVEDSSPKCRLRRVDHASFDGFSARRCSVNVTDSSVSRGIKKNRRIDAWKVQYQEIEISIHSVVRYAEAIIPHVKNFTISFFNDCD